MEEARCCCGRKAEKKEQAFLTLSDGSMGVCAVCGRIAFRRLRRRGYTVEKGAMCRMARGEMVRYMAENQIEQPEQLRSFTRLGYCFCAEDDPETVC